MNKFIGLVLLFLTASLMFPALILANTDEPEYNEAGIKKGTEVFGEDISTLSEEELQYIPEGWRDGITEEEHQHEEAPQMRSMMSAYPNVNDYIASKKYTTAKTEYNHKPLFTKFNYRYGFGHVEGVVAHETANNNSTITGEISYMERNHKNAFVHAFVDHNRIIEIHPPELGAWGGGRFANQRFVHVELVRVHSFDHFAQSMNNYADYIASILYKYNLDIVDADKHREGTLWSHRAVSNFLGGTTHTDPHGYFAKWGYNWNDFVSLVTKKYNAKVTEKAQHTSKIAHLKSSSVRIYKDPLQQSQYVLAGKQYTNEVYYSKQEYFLNGVAYYLLSREESNRTSTIGWVKGTDLSIQEHIKTSQTVADGSVIIGSGKAYNKPWGGSKNLVVTDLTANNGDRFTVQQVHQVGSTLWYGGLLNAQKVWIKAENTARETKTSKLGHLRSGTVQIYPTLGSTRNAITAGSEYTHAVYYIKKEAETGGQRYYLLSRSPSSVNGVIGWAKAEDITAQPHVVVDKQEKTFYIKGTGSAYTKAWGGRQDLAISDLSSMTHQEFSVHLTESVGNNVWYRGTLNGQRVWIHSSHVSAWKESKTSMLGHLKSTSVKIYSEPGNEKNPVTAGTEYTHAVYYIKKEAEANGQRYYLLSHSPSSTRNLVGWAKVEDISAQPHLVVDKQEKIFYLKGTGSAYAKAWGGRKDYVFSDLSSMKNQEFKVHLTESVGNTTWYRGTLEGETVWIDSGNLFELEESKVSLLGHLRSAKVKIYLDLGVEKTSITAGTEYTHAVYYIKKEAEANGQRYYLLSRSPSSTRNLVGWVKVEDISAQQHLVVDKKEKTFYLKGTGSAYAKAWGGRKDYVFSDLSSMKDQKFSVHLTESVGSSIWYRGELAGETVWIHSSYVK